MLQPRDRAVLSSLAQHRYLLARHVRALHFAESSLRVCQIRLQRYFEHGLVERLARPMVVSSLSRVALAAEPVYALSTRGARVLADATGRPVADFPSVRTARVPGWLALDHDLVTSELFVALALATRARGDPRMTATLSEYALRRSATLYEPSGRGRDQRLVPDGGFTLTAHDNRTTTFLVEVVRADVKGGNERLRRKFASYIRLHHEGHFKRVFGIEHLRAVLILTTSARRAEHFRALAANLTHGRRLFWFGSYLDQLSDGIERTKITPETVLYLRWRTVAGETVSFIQPDAGAPMAPPASNSPSSHV